jgi:hypothetical protein
MWSACPVRFVASSGAVILSPRRAQLFTAKSAKKNRKRFCAIRRFFPELRPYYDSWLASTRDALRHNGFAITAVGA